VKVRFNAVRLAAALFLTLTAATACDQSRVQGPTNAVERVGSSASLSLGNSVRLNSPADFTAGASSQNFEGLVPAGQGNVEVANAFPGITIHDDQIVRVFEPITLFFGQRILPNPWGPAMLHLNRGELVFSQPVTEIGMIVTTNAVSVGNGPSSFSAPVVLRAFDVSGHEIGAVSDQMLIATPEDLPFYQPLFIAIRTPVPMGKVRLEVMYDTDPSDGLSGMGHLVENLMAYPPLPPAPLADTDHDGVVDRDDRCPNQNPGALDANRDGCTDNVAGVGTLITAAGLPSNTVSSLMSKLDNATAKIASGQVTAAKNQLNALINEISAQRGKSIPAAVADALIAYLRNVIASL
jgi:hypothetical protein